MVVFEADSVAEDEDAAEAVDAVADAAVASRTTRRQVAKDKRTSPTL